MKRNGPTDFDFSFLRQLRNERQISLESLAEKTGISLSTLTRMEQNQNNPNLTTLSVLARFFGLSPSHLLELAGSNIIEHTEEKLEDLGVVTRRGVTYPDAQIILGESGAGGFSEPHAHPGQYQVLWVLEGRLKVRVDGREFKLAAGQSIRFSADKEHSSTYPEDTRYIVLLVPKRTR